MPPPLLELEDVSARYGQVQALHGVSLTVGEGEIVALLGANGAGKTTTLRAVSGMVRSSGAVAIGGKRQRWTPESVARAGVSHVPEGRGIFAELTVWENLRMGNYMHRGRPDFQSALAYFPWLEARKNQQAGTLSGGEQQMLALARGFMTRPRLMMLDEPSLGLAPLVTREVFRVITDLNEKEGVAVLVVEQNAALALGAAERAYVLETGQVAVSGASEELKEHASVRRAYLGY